MFMSRELLFNKIVHIAQNIFGQEVSITEETVAGDIDNWDSMNHVILISNIEQEFHINFDIMEIISIEKFGDFIDLVEKKQN